MEPIAHGVAARGHDVHLVLPWHPRLTRPAREGGVIFHPFRYAPHPSLNVFGYAGGAARRHAPALARRSPRRRSRSRPDGSRRGAWRARSARTVMHGHWVIPGGAMAALAARPAAARHQPARLGRLRRRAARAGRRVPRARRSRAPAGSPPAAPTCATARSGSAPTRAQRGGAVRRRRGALRARRRERARAVRAALGVGRRRRWSSPPAGSCARRASSILDRRRCGARAPLARRCVLVHRRRRRPARRAARSARAARRRPIGVRLRRHPVAGRRRRGWLAAADVAVVPSVRDEAGNVDGLPNVVLEALASGDAARRDPRRRHRRRGRATARPACSCPSATPRRWPRRSTTLLGDPDARARARRRGARGACIGDFGWAAGRPSASRPAYARAPPSGRSRAAEAAPKILARARGDLYHAWALTTQPPPDARGLSIFFPGLQRQRHHREHGDHGAADGARR